MKRNIPPIAALVLAEATARLGSVKEAAREQLVTSSAVSHQISSLEEWLGRPIFIRRSRRIDITKSGKRYLEDIGRLLNEIEHLSSEEVLHTATMESIIIQTTDSFANRWLVERLPNFLEQYPKIKMTVETREFSDPFKFDVADVGLIYSDNKPSDVLSKKLLSERIYPVCHPSLIDGRHHKKELFYQLPLIEDQNLGVGWHDWIAAAMVEVGSLDIGKLKHGACYNHSHLAIRAAELGDGFALASDPLVIDALAKGILVAPFESSIATGHGYYTMVPKRRKTPQIISTLISWLEHEASFMS